MSFKAFKNLFGSQSSPSKPPPPISKVKTSQNYEKWPAMILPSLRNRKMFNLSKEIPRIWMLVILVISLMLFVVACGSSDEPPPTPAPPTATATPEPPPATPTPPPPTATPTPSASDHIKQGTAHYEQGELDKASVEFNKALELEPDNSYALRNLGTVYADLGNWEEAVAAYEQAIELAPDFGEAYGDLVAAYVSLDKLSEAIEAGQKAIELAPDYATAYNNLGIAYDVQGRPDEAVAMYKQAIRLDPDDALPHYNWGLVYYRQGQVDQAIAEWQEAARLDPNYVNTHKNLGVGYLELGQTADALAEFEIYLQLAPDAPDRAAVEADIAKLTAQIAASSSGYTDEYISLTYPAGWQTYDLTRQAACQRPDIACFLGVGDPADGMNLNMLRITMPEPLSLEAVDRKVWGAFENSTPGLVLESRRELEIGGLPAVERVFSSPSSSTPDGQAYSQQVYIVSGSFLFQFTVWAPTPEARTQHQSEIDAILASVQFAPVATAATSPESVVQTIFDAAQSGNLALLQGLCDPQGENDNDTQTICNWATDETDRQEFFNYFAAAKINGEAVISPDGTQAQVPFLFGPNGDNEETMELINRDGRWYLYSF